MSFSRYRSSLARAAGAVALTAAALAGGIQGVAQAAPDATVRAPGDRKVYAIFKNHTMRQLNLVPGQTKVTEGWWMTKPKTIRSLKVVRFGSTSSTEQGGTAATIVLSTTSGQVRLAWKNPWMDDTEVNCWAPSDLRCTVDYDLGARPVVTFDLYED
ncbi:hypothetical protein ACFQFC_04875 [Amorphoplanes digitatis]|uniref:Secreted protein n=1 Tax=Actinoplanes digitatis TaxID=1868 RepID=A0A7W7MR93_9ACTN|nr:hypothetical protein [Actinoplanes digitatis]MBB4763522.1 hypothetical protein [Actinoplanes digitatis]BFE72651.1 hypothetical protein GCM10020092_059520 [Actinoplanes digitatis]GID93221.1 hypothetical protein Adi01nite_26330 [Actinoplanes digitatis]